MAVAAHRNSILLRFFIVTETRMRCQGGEEFFVYPATCPGSPPSLKRLPACRHRFINDGEGTKNIRILCREDGAFVMPHLAVSPNNDGGADRRDGCPVFAKLCYIRSSQEGSLEGGSWRITRRLPIHNAEGTGEHLVFWEADAVVPFGDSICWVDYLRGIFICDVFSPKPELQYVALPVDPYDGRHDPDTPGRPALTSNRSVCVTKKKDGCAGLRFVDLSNNSCWFYGIPRRGYNASSYSTVTSWQLSSDRRTWVVDGTIEDDEFSALTKRHDLPGTVLEFPLVDNEDPKPSTLQ